jgi:hypothetical protein
LDVHPAAEIVASLFAHAEKALAKGSWRGPITG